MADADEPLIPNPDECREPTLEGGVDYADAIRDAVYYEIDGVRIPFASPQTLLRMKQTLREKDIPDRLYLQRLLAQADKKK